MDMTGEYRIRAPRRQVWEALNDPAVLRQCIPGCDELEQVSDTELVARVTAKVGPVKAKFSGGVTLSDIAAPESYTISGEGKGGAAGFAKGSARVRLVENGDGQTVLHYEAHAQVGGKLAQLGTRLIGGTAKKMADDFFGRFSQVVAPAPVISAEDALATTADAAVADQPAVPPVIPVPAAEGRDEEAEPQPQASSETSVKSGGPLGLSPKIWILGIIVLAFVLIWVFSHG